MKTGQKQEISKKKKKEGTQNETMKKVLIARVELLSNTD